MIHITGDTHGNRDWGKIFMASRDCKIKSGDYVIICGDFGAIWHGNGKDDILLNRYATLPFTVLFVDGNHECISKDTEVLTENGWILAENLYREDNVKLANYNIENGLIDFEFPISKHKVFKDNSIIFESCNVSQEVSYNHDILLKSGKFKAIDLIDKKLQDRDFVLTGENQEIGVDISDNWIRLLTFTVSDATIIDYSKSNSNSKKCTVQFKLSKKRKIDYLISLLNEMNIKFTFKKAKKCELNKLQPYYIRIYSDYARDIYSKLNKQKSIPKEWTNFNKHQVLVFLESLRESDGSTANKTSMSINWNTVSQKDIDIVQEMCIRNNIVMIYSKRNNNGIKKGEIIYSTIHPYGKKLENFVKIRKNAYNDYMYCWTMPKGTLITRRNGICNITGNCFDKLYQYPTEDWNDGKIHKIRDNVFHLMRGQVFTIENKKFFTLGGGTSIDKEYRLQYERENSPCKIWWEQEIPTLRELDIATINLNLHKNKVDYIITHTIGNDFVKNALEFIKEDSILNEYLDSIMKTVEYKRWFCGHFHVDRDYDDYKVSMMYDRIITLEE